MKRNLILRFVLVLVLFQLGKLSSVAEPKFVLGYVAFPNVDSARNIASF